MIPGSEDPTTTAAPARDSNDETIELELTGKQELALSRAADAARGAALRDQSGPPSALPVYEHFASKRTARVDFICNVTLAVVAVAIAVALLWPASSHRAPTPALTSTAPVAEVTPVSPAEPQGAPVRVANAFDATEVFEFPHG